MEINIKKAYRFKDAEPGMIIDRLIGLRRDYLARCADMTIEALGLDLDKPISFNKLNDMIEKAMETGRPGHLDFSTSVVVYFQPEAIYVELTHFDEEVLSIIGETWPEAEDYTYSALDERPDDVTELKWKERERTWTAIRGDGLAPKEAGLSYDIAEPGDAPMITIMVTSRGKYA